MKRASVWLCLLVLVNFVAGAGDSAPARHRVVLEGSGSARFAWALEEGGVETLTAELPGEVDLALGRGCLALASPDRALHWQEISLSAEAGLATELVVPGRQGTRLMGVVTTGNPATFPASVELVGPGQGMAESCGRAVAALDVLRSGVDFHGRFQLGPLPPGRWQLAVTASFHRAEILHITTAAGIPVLDLGEIHLRPASVVAIRVDSPWEDPPFGLVVERGKRKEEQASWRFSEVERIRLEGTDVVVELEPGRYRFILTKPDTALGLSIEKEIHAGESDLVLRPVPITLEGRVVRGGRGVADARVSLFHGGYKTEAVTGALGDYAAALWAAEMYAAEVHPPDTSHEVLLIDLRDAAAGTVVTRDLELRSHELTIVVLGAPSGIPLAAAAVTVWEEGGGRLHATQHLTGEDGGVQVWLKGDMSLRVKASAEGYPEVTRVLGDRIPVSPLVITLEPGVEVVGTVRSPSGVPVPGASVVGGSPSPFNTSCAAQAGGAGEFSVACPSGSVLFAMAPGYSLGWTPAREGEVVLHLGAAQPDSIIRVQTAEGLGARAAAVTVQAADGMWIPYDALARVLLLNGRAGRTDNGGDLNLPVLPSGTYAFYLLTRSGRPFYLGVGVLPAPSPLVFRLPADPS